MTVNKQLINGQQVKTPGQRLNWASPPELNQGEWAEKLGISRGAWNTYINDQASASLKVYLTVHTLTGINLDWLILGKGQPFGQIDQSKLHTAVSSAMNLIDAAHKSGKVYTPEEATQFILTIYNTMIKETVDGTNSYGQDSALIQPKESENEPNRKAGT